MKPNRPYVSLLFATLVLCFGFVALYFNQRTALHIGQDEGQGKQPLVLQKGLKVNDLSDLLLGYMDDPKDVTLIARKICDTLNSGYVLPNLGNLNTRTFKIDVAEAASQGGELLKSRDSVSKQRLGWTSDVAAIYANPKLATDSFPTSAGSETITVRITAKSDSCTSLWDRICSLVGKPRQKPVKEPVLVRLTKHQLLTDTVSRDNETVSQSYVFDTIAQYAFTDANGEVRFNVQPTDSCQYSVLPIKLGFSYGSPQGTLTNKNFRFEQKTDRITLLDIYTYKRLKNDGVLAVRTASTYINYLVISFLLFVVMWWLVYGFVVVRDRRANKHTDTLLISILMVLTGIGLLSHFAILDPLTDTLRGWDTLKGTFFGIVLLLFVVRMDLLRFYNNGTSLFGIHVDFDFVMQFLRWANKPFGKKLDDFSNDIQRRTQNKAAINVFKGFYLLMLVALLPVILVVKLITLVCSKIPKLRDIELPEAFGYLVATATMMVLLLFFGSGPEGSSAKVNLGGFQPSEVSKVLIMIFMAVFFSKNADTIQSFSEKQQFFWRKQLKLVWGAALAIFVFMGFYMILSDGGPALVILLTFVLLYSVARRDTMQLFVGVASFVLMLIIGSKLSQPGSFALMGFFAALWFVAWTVVSWLLRKRIFESAIFFNLIIVAFLFGAPLLRTVGFENEADRLDDRNAMVMWYHNGTWDNEARGGDQVAHGYWALATGGFAGQGLGQGHPNQIPACHTDMIFASIGEEMGWVALVLIVVCMAILIHRCLLVARKVGNNFGFYLIAGLTVVTSIQFLVILLGSLGLIPLTGIAVPFLSYGRSSLVANLLIFGIILSLSREKASQRQEQYIQRYDGVITVGSLSFIVMSAIIIVWLFVFQTIKRNSTLIHPAFVTNTQGARVVEYNPRIEILMDKLNAGNIYDRNGVLLATSEASSCNNDTIVNGLTNAGIDKNDIRKTFKYPKRRYYPFGNQMFFMLGDFNTKIQWGTHDNNPSGYMAENRHLALLRGFDNVERDKNGNPVKQSLTSHKYRYSRYLEQTGTKQYSYTLYDYSALLPMLKAGTNSRKVEKWNEQRQQRDIKLTIDAQLQVKLQNELQQFANTRHNDYMRVSVVVLDAAEGDLLCSANYPLPNQDDMLARSEKHISYYSDNYSNFHAYTDRDLGTTYQTQPGSTAKVMSAMAGFMKIGPQVAQKQYFVYNEEKVDNVLGEPTGNVDLHSAIVQSSNCYFVNSVNDMDLYPQLARIYKAVGMRIDKESINSKGRTVIDSSITPYFFAPNPDYDDTLFNQAVAAMQTAGINRYQRYIANRDGQNPREPRLHKMNWNECAWAWGQGTLRATPLSMARVASIVVNNGTLAHTRFLLPLSPNDTLHKKLTSVETEQVCTSSLSLLKQYMKDQARIKGGIANAAIGGKTGTPERSHVYRNQSGKPVSFKNGNVNGRRTDKVHSENDAWYMFFVDSEGVNQSKANKLAVAVRIERAKAHSGLAMALTRDRVLKVLKELGYIN